MTRKNQRCESKSIFATTDLLRSDYAQLPAGSPSFSHSIGFPNYELADSTSAMLYRELLRKLMFSPVAQHLERLNL
jgi:hypothetical protein